MLLLRLLLYGVLLSRRRRRERCCGCSVAGTGVSALVASNLPMSSDGSSIFSVGKSSMGIKSSSASGKTGLSSGVGWGAATTFLGSAFFGSVVSTLVSAGTVLGVSATGAASCFTLRGRPGLRLGTSVSAAGVAATVGSLAASAACTEACTAGASSVFPFVSSPFLLAVNTLSAASFLTVTRERFLLVPFTFFF